MKHFIQELKPLMGDFGWKRQQIRPHFLDRLQVNWEIVDRECMEDVKVSHFPIIHSDISGNCGGSWSIRTDCGGTSNDKNK